MLDNKPATIFVGETVPFAVQKIQSDQNGNITVAIDENKRSPINIGFTLFLTPHVIPSTDMVDLTVIPKVSALSGTTSEIEGFERFSFTDEDSDNQSFIDLPRESAQTVVTYLRVHDGHTAVIGGLQTERKVEIESKVPVLSSIPILGNLFTWKRKKNNVDSLIIMITPHIIKNVGDEDSILERQRTRHQEKDFFYQRYEKGGEASPPKKPAEPTTEAPAAPPAPSAAPPTASPEPARSSRSPGGFRKKLRKPPANGYHAPQASSVARLRRFLSACFRVNSVRPRPCERPRHEQQGRSRRQELRRVRATQQRGRGAEPRPGCHSESGRKSVS
jgi:hypothetical protein